MQEGENDINIKNGIEVHESHITEDITQLNINNYKHKLLVAANIEDAIDKLIEKKIIPRTLRKVLHTKNDVISCVEHLIDK
jgi:hypothetical protein